MKNILSVIFCFSLMFINYAQRNTCNESGGNCFFYANDTNKNNSNPFFISKQEGVEKAHFTLNSKGDLYISTVSANDNDMHLYSKGLLSLYGNHKKALEVNHSGKTVVGNLSSSLIEKNGNNQLTVSDNIKITGSRSENGTSELVFGNKYENWYSGVVALVNTNGGGAGFLNPKMVFRLQKKGTHTWGDVVDRMTIYPSGNVGIGTSRDTQGYKLSVAGGIISDEVRVLPESQWPDYVFEKSYDLPTLEEVEKFITKNKHLENIPNAETVEKEGIDLGVMNAKLLEKIEELTLYLIDQNKIIKENKQEIQDLKKKLKKLSK